MNNFLGEIRLFPYPNIIPQGWYLCNGQSLIVNQNQALFSLLSYMYGGSGANFNLPNLNGRVMIGSNPLAGSTNTQQPAYPQGQGGGADTVTLTVAQMPPHTHSFIAADSYDALQPNTNYLGNGGQPSNPNQVNKNSGIPFLYNTGQPTISLNTLSITNEGSSAPHPNMQPYLTMVYCIAWQGVYPPRQ